MPLNWIISKNEKLETVNIESASLILQGIETPGFATKNRDGMYNINITAHPSGGKGTIILKGKIIIDRKAKEMKVNFILINN